MEGGGSSKFMTILEFWTENEEKFLGLRRPLRNMWTALIKIWEEEVIKHQTQERKHQRSDKSDIKNEYIRMKEMRHHKSDSSWPCWPHLNTAFFVTEQLIYFLSVGHETGRLLGHLFQKGLSRIMSLLRNLQAGLQVFSPTINMHQLVQDCKDLAATWLQWYTYRFL